jgi:hypothetical protein
MSKDENEIVKKLLTPSQMRILLDQEQWMKDVNESYTDERTRIDAAYDVKKRFPTEKSARSALETSGGDPVVTSLYKRGLNNYRTPNKKIVKSVRKCKCK